MLGNGIGKYPHARVVTGGGIYNKLIKCTTSNHYMPRYKCMQQKPLKGVYILMKTMNSNNEVFFFFRLGGGRKGVFLEISTNPRC